MDEKFILSKVEGNPSPAADMKVTKYIHSCLLVEIEDKNILIDPGEYTFNANILNLNKIENIDYLLITHEHSDHMYIPLVKQILKRFPNLQIVSNSSVGKLLAKEGINSSTESTGLIKIEPAPHEKVFGVEPPNNVLFNIGLQLTHPGDSLHFNSKTPILALPVQAPWCSLTQAVEKAESLRPQIILPIHDWHWNDKARGSFYKRLEGHFRNLGIDFIRLQTGETVTLNTVIRSK